MDQGERLFRLVARFTVHPGAEAEFDELVRRATRLTLQNEQRVVTYICYQVEGQPQERIFYEEYENRAAFVEHQAQDHTLAVSSEQGFPSGVHRGVLPDANVWWLQGSAPSSRLTVLRGRHGECQPALNHRSPVKGRLTADQRLAVWWPCPLRARRGSPEWSLVATHGHLVTVADLRCAGCGAMTGQFPS